MTIGIVGAGAFGTALALALSRHRDVILWGRARDAMAQMNRARQSGPRLPGHTLPDRLRVTASIQDLQDADVLLFCLPMQQIGKFFSNAPSLSGYKVMCCKGLDLETGLGPTCVQGVGSAAILSGPSFAKDIGQGLPTALTLACADGPTGKWLQDRLSTPELRLYRTTDVIGAELGGALKNVVAIACGAVMGAKLGVSARAALMTRGFAEMQRIAEHLGARFETLQGLSGFGDLCLTCTSDMSRNYQYGLALGSGQAPDSSVTVEGRATAEALTRHFDHLDLPVSFAVADLSAGRIDIQGAVERLTQRPLKEE